MEGKGGDGGLVFLTVTATEPPQLNPQTVLVDIGRIDKNIKKTDTLKFDDNICEEIFPKPTCSQFSGHQDWFQASLSSSTDLLTSAEPENTKDDICRRKNDGCFSDHWLFKPVEKGHLVLRKQMHFIYQYLKMFVLQRSYFI